MPGSVALGDGLTVADVVAVARDGAAAVLPDEARERMAASREVVEQALQRGDPVYGLTTGVGALRDVRVGTGQAEFNRRLVTTHAVGHGPPASAAVVRAAMLVRAQGLARGGAGVRPAVAEALCTALTDGLTPDVHVIGSLGQADLGPLAEIAAALVGAGRLELEAREGLAFVNANAFAVGWGCLAHASAEGAMAALDRSAADPHQSHCPARELRPGCPLRLRRNPGAESKESEPASHRQLRRLRCNIEPDRTGWFLIRCAS